MLLRPRPTTAVAPLARAAFSTSTPARLPPKRQVDVEALRRLQDAQQRAAQSKRGAQAQQQLGIDYERQDFGKLEPYVRPANSFLGLSSAEWGQVVTFQRPFSFRSIWDFVSATVVTWGLEWYHRDLLCQWKEFPLSRRFLLFGRAGAAHAWGGTTAKEMYEDLNRAIAAGDLNKIKSLTQFTLQSSTEAQLRALHPPPPVASRYSKSFQPTALSKKQYEWRLHRYVAPPRVVSTRSLSADRNTANPDPKKRLAQVVVRFQSEQSLTEVGKEPKPRLVKDYIMFERRLWNDKGWKMRDRLYEDPGLEPLEDNKKVEGGNA